MARRNIIDHAKTNGLYPAAPVSIAEDRVLAFFGDFGGATVTAHFYTTDNAGALQPLADSPDWTWTSMPPAQMYTFPRDMPVQFEISGATGTTDISLNIHESK